MPNPPARAIELLLYACEARWSRNRCESCAGFFKRLLWSGKRIHVHAV